jgi:hypothetical protein
MFERLAGAALCATLATLLLATGVAGASGTARVQQSDGTSQVYEHVNIRLDGQTLWVRSDDRKGTLEVTSGACSFAGAVQRCLPIATALHQHGETKAIELRHGMVYLNQTDVPQPMRHSSELLGPHEVMVLLNTTAGTIISVKGILDDVK